MTVDVTGLPAALAALFLAADPTWVAASATALANQQALIAKGAAALANNAAYLAIASPSNAQVVAQVQALTQQIDALIRMATFALSSTSGT